MSLRFTTSGAVPLPDTLQLRVAPHFRARLGAGAPTPARALTDEELVENFRWFATAGPRNRAVDRVVLSGVPAERLPTLSPVLAALRAAGAAVLSAHAEPDTVAAWAERVDHVALAVRDAADLPAVSPRNLVVTLPLEASVLPRLGALLADVRNANPARVVLAWPYPDGGPPPPPVADVIDALVGVRSVLASLPFDVKGLPTCVLAPLRRGVPDLADRATRTRNRWYVDSDHQRAEALLFVPDVLRFAKAESCRFCDADPRCDGVALAWYRMGLSGPLLPLGQGAER